MNSFFLNLPPVPQKNTITYNSKIVLFGSCFVENIGQKLEYYKLQTSINPFGISYHPEAMLNIIKRISEQKSFTESDLFFHNEQWHCFEVHSKLSNSNRNVVLKNLNQLLLQTKKELLEATHIVLTFGTAWGYSIENKTVANCHKIPQNEFEKVLTDAETLHNCFNEIFQVLKKDDPQLQIITTISPVRHIKDGIIENNQSKSHLLTALHKIIANLNFVAYYPAYEIVIDCLREYRFYKEDLVHPNQTAIDFIWQHFIATYLYEPKTKAILNKVAEIQKGLQHKPFNEQSEAHQKFVLSLREKIETLKAEFQFMDFN